MRNVDLVEAIKFFSPLSRSNRIHSNFVFRFSYCGLSESLAASSVGVDLEQIHSWDDGEEIPFSVRRVWLFESGRVTPSLSGFPEWVFRGGRVVTPDGAAYTEMQLKLALYHYDQSLR